MTLAVRQRHVLPRCHSSPLARASSRSERTLCRTRLRPTAQARDANVKQTNEAGNRAGTGSSGSSEWYEQWDMAAVHAYEARRVFIECIMHGEPEADIVKAALAISAEDDAIGVLTGPAMDECVVARPTPGGSNGRILNTIGGTAIQHTAFLVYLCQAIHLVFHLKRIWDPCDQWSPIQLDVQPEVEPALALIWVADTVLPA